jgi:hypothetical protein
MPDYSKAVIYRIVCNQTGEVYIGATVAPLWKRFSDHKSDAKCKERCCMSKQIIDRGDCYIELVEEYPCETAKQLHSREREWIEKTDCINKCIPFKTEEEKGETKKKCRDKWNPIHNAMGPIQCECGGTYTYKHKTRHMETLPHRLGTDEAFRKQWEEEQKKKKEESKLKKVEYKAKWFQEHKEELAEKRRAKK